VSPDEEWGESKVEGAAGATTAFGLVDIVGSFGAAVGEIVVVA
jgi:hypothetical protein